MKPKFFMRPNVQRDNACERARAARSCQEWATAQPVSFREGKPIDDVMSFGTDEMSPSEKSASESVDIFGPTNYTPPEVGCSHVRETYMYHRMYDRVYIDKVMYWRLKMMHASTDGDIGEAGNQAFSHAIFRTLSFSFSPSPPQSHSLQRHSFECLMYTHADLRDGMPISLLVLMMAEWDGWHMGPWPSSAPQHQQRKTTFNKAWKKGKREWRLVKMNITDSKVIEEWHLMAP